MHLARLLLQHLNNDVECTLALSPGPGLSHALNVPRLLSGAVGVLWQSNAKATASNTQPTRKERQSNRKQSKATQSIAAHATQSKATQIHAKHHAIAQVVHDSDA
jgi:hypothetical protein